jgi:hypothetical protein
MTLNPATRAHFTAVRDRTPAEDKPALREMADTLRKAMPEVSDAVLAEVVLNTVALLSVVAKRDANTTPGMVLGLGGAIAAELAGDERLAQ